MFDGLEQAGVGLVRNGLYNSRHAPEVCLVDHEVYVAVKTVGELPIAGKDAIRLALIRQGRDQRMGDSGLDLCWRLRRIRIVDEIVCRQDSIL